MPVVIFSLSLQKLFFFSSPAATLTISFLLSLCLLSVLIKMKGSFDVLFWSPDWPNTTYPHKIDKYIKNNIWFQPPPCPFYADQSDQVQRQVDHRRLQFREESVSFPMSSSVFSGAGGPVKRYLNTPAVSQHNVQIEYNCVLTFINFQVHCLLSFTPTALCSESNRCVLFSRLNGEKSASFLLTF